MLVPWTFWQHFPGIAKFEHVCEKTVSEVLSLVEQASALGRDVAVHELEEINNKIKCKELVDEGKLVITFQKREETIYDLFSMFDSFSKQVRQQLHQMNASLDFMAVLILEKSL